MYYSGPWFNIIIYSVQCNNIMIIYIYIYLCCCGPSAVKRFRKGVNDEYLSPTCTYLPVCVSKPALTHVNVKRFSAPVHYNYIILSCLLPAYRYNGYTRLLIVVNIMWMCVCLSVLPKTFSDGKQLKTKTIRRR